MLENVLMSSILGNAWLIRDQRSNWRPRGHVDDLKTCPNVPPPRPRNVPTPKSVVDNGIPSVFQLRALVPEYRRRTEAVEFFSPDLYQPGTWKRKLGPVPESSSAGLTFRLRGGHCWRHPLCPLSMFMPPPSLMKYILIFLLEQFCN